MKPALSKQKLRGGYYTPQIIADFLAQWTIISPKAHVLEPSCGDGIILEAALRTLVEKGATISKATKLVQGVEIDHIEGKKALERISAAGFNSTTNIVHFEDFF